MEDILGGVGAGMFDGLKAGESKLKAFLLRSGRQFRDKNIISNSYSRKYLNRKHLGKEQTSEDPGYKINSTIDDSIIGGKIMVNPKNVRFL